jgi:xylulose-5-phosphate/fructose-6-phosphate phosphoketolase
MAATLETAIAQIRAAQQKCRTTGAAERPLWPMIVLRSPKGWTGPIEVDGKKTEDYWRSHQVPFAEMERPEHVRLLEHWMQSYRPDELFDAGGRLMPELATLAPQFERRMGANPHANGGALLRDLHLPDFRNYAVAVTVPGSVVAESTRVTGTYLRDVMRLNPDNFRVFGPDETASNRQSARSDRPHVMAERYEYDDHPRPTPGDGNIVEHACQDGRKAIS